MTGEIAVSVKTVKPHQLGWLRRKELEKHGRHDQIWEQPDGTLIIYDATHGELLLEVVRGLERSLT